MNSIRRLYFALLSLLIFGATPSLGDGFSESLTHNEIHFTQFQTDELHQEPIASPDGRLIAYMHTEERDLGKRRLWVMGRDGKDARPLIVESRPHIQSYPKWSPDGQHIAFTSDLGGETSIWTVRVVDGILKKITDRHLGSGVFSCAATWSPDSQALVVNASSSEKDQLLEYRIVGSSPDTLYQASSIGMPTWSPDGDRILFSGEVHQNGRFWNLNVADGMVEPFNSGGVAGGYIAWSSDGKWLAFQADPGPHIYLLPATGGVPIQVTDESLVSGARTVAWDYDDQALLYSAHPLQISGFRSHLAIVDTTGENFTIIADVSQNGDANWQPPSWSPDERLIAFTSIGEDTTIAIIDTDGGGVVRNLTKGAGQTFSPDGTEIAFVHDRALWTTSLADVDPYPITLALSNGITDPEWSSDGEWISFRSRGTLWKVSSYGGEPVPLLKDKGLAWSVGWSDSSKSFHYITNRVQKGTQSAFGLGGIWQTQIATPGVGDYVTANFGWWTDISSDGTFLSAGGVSAKFGLRIYRLDTGTTKVLRFDQVPTHQAISTSISPSGTRVAFYLVREWFTSTWRADVSNLLGQPLSFP